MRVTLRITREQAARVPDLMARHEAELYVGPCYNADQGLVLEGTMLTYEGQRCPLWADGLGDVIARVLTGTAAVRACDVPEAVFDGADVVAYATSDARLKWYDTMESYLIGRASVAEVMSEIACDNRVWLLRECKAWLAGGFERLVLLDEARLQAEQGADVVALVRRARRLLGLDAGE